MNSKVIMIMIGLIDQLSQWNNTIEIVIKVKSSLNTITATANNEIDKLPADILIDKRLDKVKD